MVLLFLIAGSILTIGGINSIFTVAYGQSVNNDVPLTGDLERWKDILREDGEEAFLKECNTNSILKGAEVCDSVKEMFKDIIANETNISNETNTDNELRAPEDYETYTDKLAGYSLEYPSDWKADDSSSPSSSIFYKGGRAFEVRLWDNIEISFLDLMDVGEVAMDTATDDENEKLEKSLQSYGKNIDGEEAVTFTYSDSGVIKKVVSVIHDDKAYDFTYSSSIGTLEDNDETMNHFFNSIKFE